MDLTAHAMFALSPSLCPKHLTRDYWKYLDDMKNSKNGGMGSTLWKQSSTYARYGRSRKKKATGANAANLPLMQLILLHHIQSESADFMCGAVLSNLLTVRLRQERGHGRLWNGIHTRLGRIRLM